MTTFTYTPAQEEWLQLLEKGDLPQARGVLSCQDGMCCLGVAAKLVLKGDVVLIGEEDEEYEADEASENANGWFERIDGATVVLNPNQFKALGLRSDSGQINLDDEEARTYLRTTHPWSCGRTFDSLTTMNDNGLTFQQIAAFIRRFPQVVFR